MLFLDNMKIEYLCSSVSKKAFTLTEVMVAVSIFVTIMAFVLVTITNTFRSTSGAQSTSRLQQEMRFVFFKMGKEINSIVTTESPKVSLKGTENEFFFAYAKADAVAEAGYVYNPDDKTVNSFSEEYTDYNFTTFQDKKTLLRDVEEWHFNYSDGTQWYPAWDKTDSLPKAVKVSFKIGTDKELREVTMNIPVSR